MAQTKPATTESNAVAQNQGQVIPGLEGVEQDLLIIPRLKLVQKNSVEVDDEIAKPGQIVNSVTKDVIGKKDEPLLLIPVLNTRSRILFRPFDEGGGLLCQSSDGKNGTGEPGGICASCPENQWKNEGKKNISPNCTELLNIFCIVRGYDFPIPLTASFGRTSMGAGKQLVNFFWADAQKNQKSPWNFVYELKTEMTENEYGKFYVFKAAPGGKATKDEIEKGGLFYNLIKSTTIQVHEDEEEIRKEQAKAEGVDPDKPIPNTEPEPDDDDPFGD